MISEPTPLLIVVPWAWLTMPPELKMVACDWLVKMPPFRLVMPAVFNSMPLFWLLNKPVLVIAAPF